MNDLIDREKAINIVNTMTKRCTTNDIHDLHDLIVESLAVLPSTERTGRWLDTYNDGDWHCSECGAIVEKDEQNRHYWQRCYHCGARMVNDNGRYN